MSNIPDFFPRVNAGGFRRGAACGILQKKGKGGVAMRLPEDAARALEKLESAGGESYAVGGCVRDSLLGIEPHDWDLCTAAPPE